MKSIIILCSIAAIASAVEKVDFKIPAQSLNKLHSIATPCAEEHNVDPSNIRKLGDNTLPRDEATNKFLYCYAVNSGFVDKEGHIIVGRLSGIVGDHPLAEEFKTALNKCNDVTKDNAVATTVAVHICYLETSPIQFVF